MIKIPVGQTIRFAYDFALGHIGTVIGLIWIGMLVASVLKYFALALYYPAMAAMLESGNIGNAMGTAVVALLGYFIAFALLFSVMAGGVARQALGLRKGSAMAYFSLGSTEWQIFGATIGLALLCFTFLIGYILALEIFKFAAARFGAAVSLAAAVFALAGMLAIIYAMIRLSFFYVVAAVAEGKYGISRSWELSKGNFWRIVLLVLATLAPIAIVHVVVLVALLGPDFLVGGTMGADTAAETQRAVQQMRKSADSLPMLIGLDFILAPLVYGLILGASAAAYRALTKPSTEIVA